MARLIRPSRVVRDFTNNDGWRYNIITVPSQRRIQVWFKPPWADRFEFGHAKPIPENVSALKAADLAEKYLRGLVSHEQYNTELPPDRKERHGNTTAG